jgi:hypothetical protein
VFINPTTITTATLLHDLTGAEATTVTKSALRQQWAQQFTDDNKTPPLPHHATNTPTNHQSTQHPHKLQHNRRHITITTTPFSPASPHSNTNS